MNAEETYTFMVALALSHEGTMGPEWVKRRGLDPDALRNLFDATQTDKPILLQVLAAFELGMAASELLREGES